LAQKKINRKQNLVHGCVPDVGKLRKRGSLQGWTFSYFSLLPMLDKPYRKPLTSRGKTRAFGLKMRKNSRIRGVIQEAEKKGKKGTGKSD